MLLLGENFHENSLVLQYRAAGMFKIDWIQLQVNGVSNTYQLQVR
jgi:hypothetical protein